MADAHAKLADSDALACQIDVDGGTNNDYRTPAVDLRRSGRLDGRYIESRHHRIEHSVGRAVHARISQQQAGERPGAAAADIRRYRRGAVLSDAHTMALSVEAHAMDCGRGGARVFWARDHIRQGRPEH